MAPPYVSGVSPREGVPGTRITIRGECLGISQQDLLGVYVNGADCLLISEWKSPSKIVALAPASEGIGDILVATKSGGVGTCSVQFRIIKENNVGPLKETAVWVNEKYYSRRRKGGASIVGGEADDPLGLDVEGDSTFPEDQLTEMFPEGSGEIGSERFDPAYFLLEHHQATTFDDLKAGTEFLRRKVSGYNENQLSFIKANTNSIMDQLDTLRSVRKRYEIDRHDYGTDPTAAVESAIAKCKDEADQMFFDVLGRKDKADKTRNALTVLNRFKFLFHLPSSIRAHLNREDYDRVIEEYERARALYGSSEEPLFLTYLAEAEKGVQQMKEVLYAKIRQGALSIDQQKKLIGSLVQLEKEGDPAWESVQTRYRLTFQLMENCKNSHLEKDGSSLARASALGAPTFTTSPAAKIRSMFTPPDDPDRIPQNILFVEDVTERISVEFPQLWKLGQAYFNHELHVEPDTGKQPVFREMVLSSISFFCNLIRAAALPGTPLSNREDYGVWREAAKANMWLPHCLRQVRATYATLISQDLPGQVLDMIKSLTTELRMCSLNNILNAVVEETYVLHEKEDWVQDVSDEHGAVTKLPKLYESLVLESVGLVKEAVLSIDNREDDILEYDTTRTATELLLQKVMCAFAFTLENAATENYYSNQSDIPPDSKRLLLCLNNCKFTRSWVVPRIVKCMNDIEQLSLDKAARESVSMYRVLDQKLFDAYIELKCEPIIAIIEPNMYMGKFDWAKCVRPCGGARNYVKEILHNAVCVHAEVGRMGRDFVARVMDKLVEAVCEELNRLFCCIQRMNSNGCVQAWIDIKCVELCLQPYMSANSEAFVREAVRPLLQLEKEKDVILVQECVEEFQNSMRRHIQCLQSKL